MHPISVIKVTGIREPWDPHKLERSLRASRADDELTAKIVREVEHDMYDGMSTRNIYRHAFALLKKYNRPVAAEYSLKQAIMQLGPSGFPFERFVAAILRSQGYRTQVGVMVKGFCVEHETDIIAEKAGERLIVEAKYHNASEIRSDVKVALYVHARFLDIQKQIEQSAAGIDYYTRPWLITNTNFTSQAIQYGSCAGLAMTGWNYPKGHTLQDLVQATQSHPLTCLTTLTNPQKNALLTEGIVLCRDVVSNTHALEKIGVNKARIAAVVEEGERLCPVQ